MDPSVGRGLLQGFRHRRRAEGWACAVFRSSAAEEPQILEVFVEVWLDYFSLILIHESVSRLCWRLILFVFSPVFRKTGSFTNEEAVVLALKETLRYGLFLGTFAGTYVSVDEIIASFAGRKR